MKKSIALLIISLCIVFALKAQVKDTIAPVITMNGDSEISIQYLDSVTSAFDPGATATDNVDKKVSIVSSGTFYPTIINGKAARIGYFTIVYSARDSAGNSSSKTRWVKVFDTIAPKVFLKGSKYSTGCKAAKYVDSGFTVIDNYTVSGPKIVIEGDIALLDTTPISDTGTYRIRFKVIDSSGNVGYSEWRIVKVVDCVWPGDADFNKKVEMADVLSISLAFGDTGSKRADTSTVWKACPGKDWSFKFASGLNEKHADCNGSGNIDSTDVDAVLRNYGKSHPKAGQRLHSKTSPVLRFEFVNDIIHAGDIAKVRILLGSSTLPADSIYGLAVSLGYDTGFVGTVPSKITLLSSWLVTNKMFLKVIHEDRKAGRMDFAITRTDHTDISGYGEIGEIEFVTRKNIDVQQLSKVFKLECLDVLAVSARGTEKDFQLETDSVLVKQNNLGVEELQESYRSKRIYPNPTTGRIYLKNVRNGQITITDLTGRSIGFSKTESAIQGDFVAELSFCQPGCYLVRYSSGDEDVVERVILVK